jgi:hypothetical protein
VEAMERSGQVRNHMVRVRTKSGEVRQAEFSADLIELQGEPCMLAVAPDRTESLRADQALREVRASCRGNRDRRPLGSNRVVESVVAGVAGLQRGRATRVVDPRIRPP